MNDHRNFNNRKNTICVIIGLYGLTDWLQQQLNEFLPYEGEQEISGLVRNIKQSLLSALISFIKSERSPIGKNYNEWFHQALDLLCFHGMPTEAAATICSKAETMMMQSMVGYFPNVDETEKLNVVKFSLLADGSACLIVEVLV